MMGMKGDSIGPFCSVTAYSGSYRTMLTQLFHTYIDIYIYFYTMYTYTYTYIYACVYVFIYN
jgi:hypothetical protein